MSCYICKVQEHSHTTSIPLKLYNSAHLACNAVCNMVQVHTKFGGAFILPPHRQTCNSDHAYYYVKSFHQDWGYNKRLNLFDTAGWL